jgi:hypothetical protein
MSTDKTVTEEAGELTGMWKGKSTVLTLTDEVDATRTDLIADFERDPLARHDVELQVLVSGVRGSARIPRLVLSQLDFGRWVVTEIAATRGAEPRQLLPRVFDDLRDAERYVFSYRLQLLAALHTEEAAR